MAPPPSWPRPFAPPPPPPRLMSSPPEKSATGADGAPGLTADARNLLARRLGREMLELAHVQPFSPAGAVLRAERRAVDLLVRQVAAVVQTLNPGVAVEVFGSFPTASWVPGASNLDLAIALPEAVASNPRAKMDALNSLAVALRSNGWVIDVNVLPTARPLIIMNTHTAFFQPPPNMGGPDTENMLEGLASVEDRMAMILKLGYMGAGADMAAVLEAA